MKKYEHTFLVTTIPAVPGSALGAEIYDLVTPEVRKKKCCGCAKGGLGGGGKDWESGVSRCKLLHIEWMDNKVLPYSTGNCSQSPVINHNGKEYEKNVYLCITDSLCCTAKINPAL